MSKKIISYLFLTGLFLVLTLYTRHKMDSGDRIHTYAERIEEGLHNHQIKVQKVIDDEEFLKRRLSASSSVANLQDDEDLTKLEDLSAEPFSIVFKKDGDFKFWTSTAAPFEAIDYDQIPNTGELTKLDLSNGTYIGKYESIQDPMFQDYDVYSLFPIKRIFNIESQYLNKPVSYTHLTLPTILLV